MVAEHFSELFANEALPAAQGPRKRQVRAAQIHLLYSNANTGIAVTAIAAPALAYFQWEVVQPPVVLSWLLYMLVVSIARFILTRRYWRSSPNCTGINRWSVLFAGGAGMAAAGWGAAGILLYPEARLMNQVFLVFVLGGMMLGGASLLAPRSEAFLAFLLPTGVLPALRFISDGDEGHVVMGLLAILFTVAMVTTTWRIHRTIESSLSLKFENQDLLEDLQVAKSRTETLNQQLELRVQERTAELHESTVRLRAEIEQREHIEEELLRARKLESLGVLAGGIAHDFNNFLTIIEGNIEVATTQLSPGAPVREILEQTATACQRAASLSSQLLTFAKGGAPIRRVVSVATLISDAVRLTLAGAAVSIAVHIADDLWSAEVDAGQVGQVFHNILLNAKQATLEGGSIEVRAENVTVHDDKRHRPRAHVRISIRDSGCGITPDILPLIFDPYFTTKQSGSGLGLATAYAIVSKHGGRLSVESKYGEGTVFVVDLPASHSTPAPEPPDAARLRSGTGRLLVMDDEENIRALLSQVLTRLGYEVLSASHGAEAIQLYKAATAAGRGFDAVLLDLTVAGGMGGVETAKKLKELDPSAKLIASSGYSDAPVMSSFREYGFDDTILKPWTVAQLSEVFRAVLVNADDSL
jgi:signal transduction histidine kinase/CheY-like chemotaxis protein